MERHKVSDEDIATYIKLISNSLMKVSMVNIRKGIEYHLNASYHIPHAETM